MLKCISYRRIISKYISAPADLPRTYSLLYISYSIPASYHTYTTAA